MYYFEYCVLYLVHEYPSIPISLLKQEEIPSENQKIKIWTSCPSGYKYAIKNIITFNISFDAVEIHETTHSSVYIITATLNNSLNRLRKKDFGLFRMVVLPQNDGKIKDSISRAALGALVHHIYEEGKQGVYIEKNNLLYHVYFGLHACIADLKAAMQLYDRPGCTNSDQPCITHDCTVGCFDVATQSYTNPKKCPFINESELKTSGRSLCLFPPGSVYRSLPFLGICAHDLCINIATNESNLISIYKSFFHSQLSNLELQIIKSLYKFLYQFGSEYFPLQFIEVGSYEKDEFKREFEVDENLPFVDRRFLIRLFESCQLTKEGAYPCDFMHFIANTIIRMISFVNDSYVKE